MSRPANINAQNANNTSKITHKNYQIFHIINKMVVILNFSCSLECYKLHQQRELCHPLGTTVTETDVATQIESVKSLQMFTTDDTVTVENLQKLGNILNSIYCFLYSK